jgi:hypothetical protein
MPAVEADVFGVGIARWPRAQRQPLIGDLTKPKAVVCSG